MKKVVKKSDNQQRLQRLKASMDDLNYIDRVVSDVFSVFRERKSNAVAKIRELLLDEDISPDLLDRVAQIEVDPEEGEIRYVLKDSPTTPTGPRLNPAPEEPHEEAPPPKSQPIAKKAAKKASKKRTRKR